MSSATLITVVVLTVAAGVLGVLIRRFRSSGARTPDAIAAAAAITIGALLLAIPGALHTIVIATSAIRADRAYDARLAWLLTIGLVIVYAGITTVAAAPGLRRGSREAFSRAAWSAALLLAFLLLLAPVMDQKVLIAITAPYLGLLQWRLRV